MAIFNNKEYPAFRVRYRFIRNILLTLILAFAISFVRGFTWYFSQYPLSFESLYKVLLFGEGNWKITFSLQASWFFMLVLGIWHTKFASFRCPECDFAIPARIDWVCKYCKEDGEHYTVHRNPIWFTVLHRCRNTLCRTEPEAFECPHCHKTISLTCEPEKKEKKPAEKRVATKADPPTPKPKPTPQPRQDQPFP